MIARFQCYLDPLPPPPHFIKKKTNKLKNNFVRVGPPLAKVSGSAHEYNHNIWLFELRLYFLSPFNPQELVFNLDRTNKSLYILYNTIHMYCNVKIMNDYFHLNFTDLYNNVTIH